MGTFLLFFFLFKCQTIIHENKTFNRFTWRILFLQLRIWMLYSYQILTLCSLTILDACSKEGCFLSLFNLFCLSTFPHVVGLFQSWQKRIILKLAIADTGIMNSATSGSV